MSALSAWVLSASLQVKDDAGHKSMRPIANDGAIAIDSVCTSIRGAIPGAPLACASVLLILAFRESNYNALATHDGGRGCGAFGVLCTRPHATWLQQVQSAFAIVQASAAKCSEPLSLYASGSCTNKTGIAISKARMAAAKQLILDVPFTPTDGSPTKT